MASFPAQTPQSPPPHTAPAPAETPAKPHAASRLPGGCPQTTASSRQRLRLKHIQHRPRQPPGIQRRQQVRPSPHARPAQRSPPRPRAAASAMVSAHIAPRVSRRIRQQANQDVRPPPGKHPAPPPRQSTPPPPLFFAVRDHPETRNPSPRSIPAECTPRLPSPITPTRVSAASPPGRHLHPPPRRLPRNGRRQVPQQRQRRQAHILPHALHGSPPHPPARSPRAAASPGRIDDVVHPRPAAQDQPQDPAAAPATPAPAPTRTHTPRHPGPPPGPCHHRTSRCGATARNSACHSGTAASPPELTSRIMRIPVLCIALWRQPGPSLSRRCGQVEAAQVPHPAVNQEGSHAPQQCC